MLTTERQGEIALLYLKNKLGKDGVRLSKDMNRQIAATAKEIGIDVKEATDFAELIVRSLVEDAFKKPGRTQETL